MKSPAHWKTEKLENRNRLNGFSEVLTTLEAASSVSLTSFSRLLSLFSLSVFQFFCVRDVFQPFPGKHSCLSLWGMTMTPEDSADRRERIRRLLPAPWTLGRELDLPDPKPDDDPDPVIGAEMHQPNYGEQTP